MKKLYLLLVAIVAIGTAKAQNEWVTYKADNKLTIKLPTLPRQIDDITQMALDRDSLIYIVSVVDLSKTDGTDSTELVTMAVTPEYANMIKTSLAKSIPSFAMGDITVGKWKGNTCYHLDGVDAANQRKLYCFLFIIGSKMYGLTAIVPDNKSIGGRDYFWDSAVVR
ncbi:hypothetical protein BH09BAC6_BH09BAC6_09370 [soil metagenome]|jgi:hypothetical protein